MFAWVTVLRFYNTDCVKETYPPMDRHHHPRCWSYLRCWFLGVLFVLILILVFYLFFFWFWFVCFRVFVIFVCACVFCFHFENNFKNYCRYHSIDVLCIFCTSPTLKISKISIFWLILWTIICSLYTKTGEYEEMYICSQYVDKYVF